MKTIKNFYSVIILFAFAALFFASASVESKYYQSYNTTPENGNIIDNSITFEDENCKVFYDLWSEGGDVGFTMYNKTSDYIKVNIDKSFFVINGSAYSYYKNRVFSNSSNLVNSRSYITNNYLNYYNPVVGTVSASTVSTTGNSVSYSENATRIIPPKTSISISEYTIADEFYSSCDLLKFPSKKEIKSLTFEKDNSPYVFYNIISYSLNDAEKTLENRFYVSEVKNLPASEMFESVKKVNCGEKNGTMIQVFKESSPKGFYLIYSKNSKDDTKH
jgi:hypothetical protein